MSELFLWILIAVLVLIILILSISVLLIIKKATYLSKKERDFIVFAIDMYITYGEEIGINSPEEQETLIKELEKVKNKVNNNE